MFFSKGNFVLIIIESLFLITNGNLLSQDIFNNRREQNICNDRFRWNSNGITVVGDSKTGILPNQLNSPRGLFFHQKTRTLYIADRDNHRIQQLSPDGQIKTVAGDPNGNSGTQDNRLNMPSAIFIDENENLFIADTNNHRVQKWTKGAMSGTTVAGQTANPGSSLDQLNKPEAIWVDTKSNLYIADLENHRIIKRTSHSSDIVAGGNAGGDLPNQLNGPVGLYFDESLNTLLISNYFGNSITKWKIGDTQGIIIAGTAGQSGNSSTELSAPSTVMLDTKSYMYAADTYNQRILIFCSSSSKEGKTIAGITGSNGNSSNLLNFPHDIALDMENLDLFVSDSQNHRIQKFSYISPSSNGIILQMGHYFILTLIIISFILYE